MRAGPTARGAVVAAAAGVLALSVAPAALAVAPAASATSAAPTSAPGRAARLVVGGAQLAAPGIVVNYPAGKFPRLPAVPASAYIIADATTGQVLAARDPHGEFAPASTLKVLTAITLLPRLSPDAMVLATRQAADTEPNDVGLIPGRRYAAADLFRALLLISANDAAVALTQATGSFAEGMSLINAEAQHLQAYDVVAKQPNGLPADGQVASAYDEALIARQALAIPAFMHDDSLLAARFLVKPKHWVTLVNQNYLLTQYRGGIGGKIGWTARSKATYMGMARRNGVTLIVAVLHCTPLEEITAGEHLLDWGFAADGRVRPVGTLVSALQPAAIARPAVRDSSPARPAPGAAVHARAARLGSAAEARTSGDTAGLAAAAAAAVAVALAVGLLARSRRRKATSDRS
jgi:serine-type D-Ala-D-Ala carboxypeptidase (penicillin-binding protein 5/6)